MSIKTSEALNLFLPAFLKAQQAVGHALKNANNPHHKSKYANLEEVIDTIKEPLNKNDIVYMQHPTGVGLDIKLTTRLQHISGQYMESDYSLPAGAKANIAQEAGSHITYMRRYALTSILGIFQEDDDANAYGKSKHSEGPKQGDTTSSQQPAGFTPKAGAIAGEYTPNFGKFRGQAIKNISPKEIVSYITYLTKDGKRPTGEAAEFISNAESYLRGDETPPPSDSDFPFSN